MKTNKLCLGILFLTGLFCYYNSDAQYILAGQTEGENIHYFDIEDIYMYAEPYSPASHIMVLYGQSLHVQFYAWHWGDSQGTSGFADNDAWLSVTSQNDYYIEKHDFGDTIGPGLNWEDQELLYCYYDDYGGSGGVFWGSGFVGFKIIEGDTVYGWIGVDISAGDFHIFDYAFYCENYVGIEEYKKKTVVLNCSNPVTDKLILSSGENKDLTFRLYNALGCIVIVGEIKQGDNTISIQHLQRGLYFLHVDNREVFKILKN